jgi:hypothetical protein
MAPGQAYNPSDVDFVHTAARCCHAALNGQESRGEAGYVSWINALSRKGHNAR